MTPTNSSRPKSRKIWIFLVLILMVAAGGFGYQYWNQKSVAQTQAAASTLKTKQVRTGSITIGASGTVSVVASQETDLAFTVSGTVAKLNVSAGDKVKKDQVLAQLDNLDQLQANIKDAEQTLLSAQQDLDTLKAQAPANLANAQLAVIEAQKTVEDKQSSVVQKDWQRCDDTTKLAYYKRYTTAVSKLKALGDGGGSADYYLNKILPQKQVVDQALASYKACDGYTAYQVASTQANLSVAEAALKQAQDALDALTQNNGLNPVDVAAAENQVASAQQALDSAKDDLAGATLTAPFDGTIMTVSGKAGDTITIDARTTRVVFISMADLDHPLVQYTIDQYDLGLVAKGEAATVIFDSYADRTFKGTVTRVDPALASTDGSTSVSGLIQLDLSQEKNVPSFAKNLTGSVLIVQSSAENVLLVPIEALHQQSDGTYGVYVVGADGQPTLKPVEVGLSDVASAEIKSGLAASDVVVTSAVQ